MRGKNILVIYFLIAFYPVFMTSEQVKKSFCQDSLSKFLDFLFCLNAIRVRFTERIEKLKRTWKKTLVLLVLLGYMR